MLIRSTFLGPKLSVMSQMLSTNLNVKRGSFILFEGIDRCGKTTQCGMLSHHLKQSRSCEQIRFPNRTSCIGQLINSYLTSASEVNDRTIHLLFSANRWESRSSIEQLLSEGTSIVCDRYAYSGVAFSSAKGLDLDWCKACDRGLPAPDCVIYLDMPVEEAAQRGNFGEERYEKVEFQLKVRDKFMTLRQDDNQIPWHVIDARGSIESIHTNIKQIVDAVIASTDNKPIASLWV